MKLARNLIVVFATLALVGFLKEPWDDRLDADLRERGLVAEPIEIDTMEELGQTSLAIALGGLRSVIAPLLNIGAHVDWENQRWYELEQKYRTIVTLQPQTRYYWVTGAWHLHKNAYADFRDQPGIPEGNRQEMLKTVFNKGIAFLEEGVGEMPDDPLIWDELGSALSDPNRPRDLSRAAEAFGRSHEISGSLQTMRKRLYALCRLEGREAEAWDAAKEMWAIPHNRRFTSMRTIFFTLQNRARPPASERIPLEEVFGGAHLSPEHARRVALLDLSDYWFRQNEDYPVDGLKEIINRLCDEFAVPEEIHPLRFDWDQRFTLSPATGKRFGRSLASGEIRRRPWLSIWMGDLRHAFRAWIDPTNPPRTLLALSRLWLKLEADAVMPGVRNAIEELLATLAVPEVLSPLLHHPAETFSENPLTGESLGIDPETGEPLRLRWETVWEETALPALKEFFGIPNP